MSEFEDFAARAKMSALRLGPSTASAASSPPHHSQRPSQPEGKPGSQGAAAAAVDGPPASRPAAFGARGRVPGSQGAAEAASTAAASEAAGEGPLSRATIEAGAAAAEATAAAEVGSQGGTAAAGGEGSQGGGAAPEWGPQAKLLVMDDLPYAAEPEQRQRLAEALAELLSTARFPTVLMGTEVTNRGAASERLASNPAGLHPVRPRPYDLSVSVVIPTINPKTMQP